ncbi:hypothetical protein HY031_00965 [Candidatus Gottesmanbacteria bacterium]|nr:hypothetical protein [Candidatus Gottesmanbacteria bacterium]
MNINRDEATYQPPFTILIIDALDAYYYADIIEGEENELFARIDTYPLAKTLADALFITKNFMWDSLDAMNKLDAGYDVRVYDASYSCVYAVHEKFKKRMDSRRP